MRAVGGAAALVHVYPDVLQGCTGPYSNGPLLR